MNNARGFSYLEVMVALLVLGICALPAADAIRSGANAALVAAARAQELRCLKNHMEFVLAEPYERLAAEAEARLGATPPPPAYYRAPDTACGERFVLIQHYERKFQAAERILDAANSTLAQRSENGMLRIVVAPADPANPAAAAPDGRSYTFTTLVIR